MTQFTQKLPDENQAAYKGFAPPKQKAYKIHDLSEINVDAMAVTLIRLIRECKLI